MHALVHTDEQKMFRPGISFGYEEGQQAFDYFERTHDTSIYQPGDKQLYHGILHKRMIRYADETEWLYDSMVHAGFKKVLEPKDITAKCKWSARVLRIDTTQYIGPEFCGSADDTIRRFYKAVIQFDFYDPANRRRIQLEFGGYAGRSKNGSFDANAYAYNEKTASFRTTWFPGCNMYEFDFPVYLYGHDCVDNGERLVMYF